MDKPLPYREQQDCILHGIALIASISPQILTPDLRQMRDGMLEALTLNARMFDRGDKYWTYYLNADHLK